VALDLLPDLAARGLLHDHTDLDALRERLAAGPVVLYHGIDPTADSLHVGHLLGIVMLRRFQLSGHLPIAVVGGATGMIGDPSGRSNERNLLDEATLAHNVAAISAQVEGLLAAGDGVAAARLVDNAAWTRDLTLVDFLRTVGKSVTVNQMVARESVKARMAGTEGISFTEFTYMLLQANDFAWLNEHEGCELQIGGSDQWGNIASGVDLVRRWSGRSVHGLTWPLLTRADGSKFGKSQGENVWLDPERTSPYRFFQFWMQTEDADVQSRLLQLTLLPVEEARAVAERHAEAPAKRLAQRRLAEEITTMVHGASAASAAAAASEVLFGAGLDGVSEETLQMVATEVPTTRLSSDDLAAMGPADLLVRCGLAKSKGEAQRILAQGGASLDGTTIDPDGPLDVARARYGRYLLLRRGKRNHAMAIVEP
jgi:tyrosyl-tRNA synthetase